MTDQSTTDPEQFEYSRTIRNGFDRCVRCGIIFGAENRDGDIRGEEQSPGVGSGVNYTYGPVRDRAGNQYENVGDSEPGTYLMHDDCYQEYHAELKAKENESLQEYVPNGSGESE